MKILYFSRDYTPHDHRFLSALAETDHQVHYLRFERGRHQLEGRPLPNQIEMIRWSGGTAPATVKDIPRLVAELRAILKKLKPDLVHAGPLQRSAFIVALSGYSPLLSMSWGYDLLQDADRNVFWRWATRYTLSRSTLMIGDCDTVRKIAVSYGMPEERIVTFPWGIDLNHFSPHSAGKTSQPESKPFTLLSTRSWEPIYGIDVIVEAFIIAVRKIPELRLVMLGNGSQAQSIRKTLLQADLGDAITAATSGTGPQVIFPGHVSQSDLPRYYRSADLYVAASHSDGTSISLLEAFACALPALVSDIPGNREWIEPELNGWLFPDGDPLAMANGILNAAQNRNRLKNMGLAARKTAETRADWASNFPKLLDAYRLVFSKG